MNNLNENLNKIFDLLLDKDTYSKYGINKQAKYWKIGTTIFGTFDRLIENIKDVDISFPLVSILNKKNKTVQGNNISFQFHIKDINVTPCKVRGFVSSSAIHQYKSMICAFNLGVEDGKYKSKKDFVENNGKLKLVANIKELLKKENRIKLIIKTIVQSLFSNIEDLRKISYSILIETLFTFNFDFKNLSEKNQIFYPQKRNCRTLKAYSLINELKQIKKSIYKQGTKATYKEVIETIKYYYSNINDFINEIWNQYKLLENNNNFEEKVDNQITDIRLNNLIKNERSKFKNNIFEDRKSKGLIKSKNDYYTDIIDYDNSTNGLLSLFNESNACHIMEYNKIKSLLNFKKYDNEEEKEELKSFISNPNNGLMMNIEYHKSFDRGQWTFDANGEMLVNKENEHYLFEIKKLKRIKINPKVFNKKMKEFLMKR